MKGSHKIITDYVILIVSFVIAWIEVWFLELRVFSQERFVMSPQTGNLLILMKLSEYFKFWIKFH